MKAKIKDIVPMTYIDRYDFLPEMYKEGVFEFEHPMAILHPETLTTCDNVENWWMIVSEKHSSTSPVYHISWLEVVDEQKS